jgi:hypothetical protein
MFRLFTNISDLQGGEITPTQITVDAEVEQRELPHPVLHLKVNPQRPDVFEFERGLLPDDIALLLRLTNSVDACDAHGGLPSS